MAPKAQATVSFGKALRWWEKSLQPNMIEINSAPELVDYLLNSGDRLVIVDFYSPGCGGCKALHPKICQLAEQNPNAIFLKVNYEQHKAMCYALHVHVLPFFRFYRGAQGKVCSFSCTNATIKKFKDALAKHGTERCSLGPAKGLDESELLALASIGQISLDLVPNSTEEEKMEDLVLKESVKSNNALSKGENKMGLKEGNAMRSVKRIILPRSIIPRILTLFWSAVGKENAEHSSATLNKKSDTPPSQVQNSHIINNEILTHQLNNS
ncbi:hypothetical protein DH2020_013062 [Rehmannia glutinosa]|uniref:Thioredoxin domain-containing protein n=1 Tax=Rehmannia glutinosa TaxID=99300 RepID=A0ABR0X2D1_REHGL